ncbi:MAG: hypothetical protein IJT24_05425 [Lachnospiraceae bacterium]|nr:hypothetical protein [Lachnospiraceae bacterium]
MKTMKRHFIYILAVPEVMILTGIYYYFWRIGYTHGIAGYPEYLGMGKFILMGIYALLTGIILFFTGAFRYRRLRVGNIILRQWGVMLAVNLITFLQLSLTAKHLVAKRPMFDATVVQAVFIVIYAFAADLIIKYYRMAGKMLVIGEGGEDIREGGSLDGYSIAAIDTEEHSMVDISSLFEKADGFDAILIRRSDETMEYLIKHCLERKKAVYLTRKDPMIYGVSRVREAGKSYILVLGMGEDEGRLFDRVRAYLA